jgi:diguanylate cyclase (GGDEF)-like protein
LWVMPATTVFIGLAQWLVAGHNTTVPAQEVWPWVFKLAALGSMVALLALWQVRLYHRLFRAWSVAEGWPKSFRPVFKEGMGLWLAMAMVCYAVCQDGVWLVWLYWPLLAWGWALPKRALIKIALLTTGLCSVALWAWPPTTSRLAWVPMVMLTGVAVWALYRLQRWVGKQTHALDDLASMASTDALTGLINRREFNQRLTAEIARARRHQHPLTLALFDIDHFKHINDAFGHPVGDQLLRELGALLLANVREHDLPARYGGEEFALILPVTTLEAGVDLTERLRMLVARHVFCLPDMPVGVTISVGVALFHSQEDTQFTFVERADAALYAAKHNGRNQVVAGIEPLSNPT